MDIKDELVIFSARIARDLIQRKFELVDIRPHKDIGIKTVFFFRDTNEIRRYLKQKHSIKI